jgi:menaquinone-9 beta-reductase
VPRRIDQKIAAALKEEIAGLTAQIENVDVLIVGSGPSGSSTALHLVQQDPTWAGRILVVDKAVHPREKLCGGGVTHLGTDILARLGLRFEPRHFMVREVRLTLRRQELRFLGNPAFRVTRRDEFDHWLVQQVEAAASPCARVKRWLTSASRMTTSWSSPSAHDPCARVVVAADGSRSFVRRRLKWDDDSRVARLLEVLTPEDARRQVEFREGWPSSTSRR